MVQIRWLGRSEWPRPWMTVAQATVRRGKEVGRYLCSVKDQLVDAKDLQVLNEACLDATELSRRVLKNVVARVEGGKGDPVLPVAALAQLLPHEDAANELLHLATLENAPYKRELQAAFGRAGAISALADALKGNGTPCAKQRAALALCSMARSSPSNRRAAKTAVEAALQDYMNCGASEISCTALTFLLEDGICQPAHVLDVLISISEKRSDDIELQMRASNMLQGLVYSGAVDLHYARKRAGLLASSHWSELLSRFQGAGCDSERQQGNFHEEVQAMFHEEVVRHFEYEAAERVLHLQQQGAPCDVRLRAVIRCFVQNLEDYQRRLESRESAWDAIAQQLVPLSEELRHRLSEEVRRKMEPGLIHALQAAACGYYRVLRRRSARLRSECTALLELKTEVTREHQDRAASMRREAVLFQAVEYLESQPMDACIAQVRVAQHMFELVEPTAPKDAVLRLRERLEYLASGRMLAITAG